MKTIPTVATAGLLAVSLVACGGGGGSGGGANVVEGGTFTFIISADPGNLDPHFTSLSSTFQVDRFLYDSLVNIDAKVRWSRGSRRSGPPPRPRRLSRSARA